MNKLFKKHTSTIGIKEVIDAVEVIRTFFENKNNFKTRPDKLQGIMISDQMDLISSQFIETHIRPDLVEQARHVIVDIGAKA